MITQYEFAESNKNSYFNNKLSECINIIRLNSDKYFVSFTMIKKIDLPSLLDVVIEHRKIPSNLFDRVTIILQAVNIETELESIIIKKEKILEAYFE